MKRLMGVQVAFSVVTLVACSDGHRENEKADVPLVSGVDPRHGAESKKKGTPLVEIANEPPGAHCPAGGTVLRSGKDADFDGKLEADEIESVQYACHGNDGKTPLLKSTPEPVGTRCPTGGQAIGWGYDSNGNGVLDAVEIKDSTYVCNGATGATGATGANGKNALVTLLDIPVGDARCSSGGKGVYTGIDANGDGLLQPAEVQGSSFVCNGATSLVLSATEPPGTNCTNGGQRFVSGIDANADGNLDGAEIAKVGFVCNGVKGADGLRAIARTAPEPAGVHCAAGGQRIEAGSDVNANGTLDAEEIAQTAYVCNGAAGGAGLTLTRTMPLEGGTPCPSGGLEVVVGFDGSGDGTLQEGEIATRFSVCRAIRKSKTPLVCTTGSTAMEVGLDRDGDGTLSDAEVSGVECMRVRDSLVTGREHSCFRNVLQGTVSCWGTLNFSANRMTRDPMIGVATNPGVEIKLEPNGQPPVRVAALSAIGADSFHTCAIAAGGAVYCWGLNDDAQLGGDAPTRVFASVKVAGVTGAVAAATSETESCVVRTDGTVRCWGEAPDGAAAPNIVGAVGITMSGGEHDVLLVDGTTARWGTVRYNAIASQTPVAITDVTSIRTGASPYGIKVGTGSPGHVCAGRRDGTVWCWGRNETFELGIATSTNPQIVPSLVPGLTGVRAVATGGRHSCAMLEDGGVRCWGNGTKGELGDGASTTNASPVSVTGLINAVEISAGAAHTCALTSESGVRCWGDNSADQIKHTSVSSSPTPVIVVGP